MADSVQMRAPVHYLRVNLEDPAEAEYWQVVFDCERARLEAALAAVGPDALDVQRWLNAATATSAATPSTAMRPQSPPSA
jgi:hypothetical protein